MRQEACASWIMKALPTTCNSWTSSASTRSSTFHVGDNLSTRAQKPSGADEEATSARGVALRRAMSYIGNEPWDELHWNGMSFSQDGYGRMRFKTDIPENRPECVHQNGSFFPTVREYFPTMRRNFPTIRGKFPTVRANFPTVKVNIRRSDAISDGQGQCSDGH